MSLPKRYVEIDPSTPFEDVAKLIAEGSDEVEVKSGPELFVVHRAATAVVAPIDDEKAKARPNAVKAMREFAGSWKGRKEIDDYLGWREEQKTLDIERQERLWSE